MSSEPGEQNSDVSDIYAEYVGTRSIIETAMVAETALNGAEALSQYQLAIDRLENALGKENKEKLSANMARVTDMMKQALECCRARVVTLDLDISKCVKCIWKSEALVSDIPEVSEIKVDIPGGVQLFGVLGTGDIFALTVKPTPLQVIRIPFTPTISNPGDSDDTHIKLKAGHWIYSLKHGTRIHKRLNEVYEMPPNCTDIPDMCKKFAFVISNDLDPMYREDLERILKNLGVLKIDPPRPRGGKVINLSKTIRYNPGGGAAKLDPTEAPLNETADQITKRFDECADLICDGIAQGANFSTTLIHTSSRTLQRVIPLAINPPNMSNLVDAVETAKLASEQGLEVSSTLVDRCAQVSNAAKQAIMSVLPVPEPPTEEIIIEIPQASFTNDVLAVAKSGAKGLGRIFSGMDDAKKEIRQAASSAALDQVHHRLGAEAALIIKSANETRDNVNKARSNYSQLDVKKMAKKLGETTGKDFLKSYIESSIPPPIFKQMN